MLNPVPFAGVVIISLIATILVFKFIIPESRKPSLNKIGLFFHNMFNIKTLLIEKILKVCYVFSTIAVFFYGLIAFFTLYRVEVDVDAYRYKEIWDGSKGLWIMLLGPILVRLAYELLMMAILLLKNVMEINQKLSAPINTPDEATDEFSEVFNRQTLTEDGQSDIASTTELYIPDIDILKSAPNTKDRSQ